MQQTEIDVKVTINETSVENDVPVAANGVTSEKNGAVTRELEAPPAGNNAPQKAVVVTEVENNNFTVTSKQQLKVSREEERSRPSGKDHRKGKHKLGAPLHDLLLFRKKKKPPLNRRSKRGSYHLHPPKRNEGETTTDFDDETDDSGDESECTADSKMFKVALWTLCNLLNVCQVNSRGNRTSQPAITCSKLTIETIEQGVKYVQS